MNAKNNNGWTKVEKRHGGGTGLYAKYSNRIVVVVPKEKNEDHIALTVAGYEALGKPERVDIYTRGTNVAITASADNGYKVSTYHGRDQNVYLYYLTPSRWRRDWKLRAGIYEAHIENGMIVFDTAQMPTMF